MKLNDRYVLRELAGCGVLVPARVSDPSVRTEAGELRTVKLSGSAFWLLKFFAGLDFSMEQAVDAVCGHYDVDRSSALTDINQMIDTLRSCGAMEG